MLMDRLRIAVYHHLHSGGAKRVVAEQVSHLQHRHNITIFSLTTADHSSLHWIVGWRIMHRYGLPASALPK